MVAVSGEPFVSLAEFAAGPESPVSNARTGEDESPGTAGVGDDGVLVQGGTVAECASLEVIGPGGALVRVAPSQDESNEPPRMVMVGAIIVGAEPVVQADGADA